MDTEINQHTEITVQNAEVSDIATDSESENAEKKKTDSGETSRFVGKPTNYYLMNLFMILASLMSVSLLYPLVFFIFERWKTENSYIDGKKLSFVGKLYQAYLIYCFGVFCTALTLFLINLILFYLPFDLPILNGALSGLGAGINTFFVTNRLRRWKKKNTHYDGFLPGNSYMKTNLLKCVIMNIGSYLLGFITLGLGYPLVFKRKEAYYTDLSVVDGDDIELRGNAAKLYGKWLLGILLCIVTLGFFIPLINYFLYKWTAENTHVKLVGETD